MLKLPSLLSMSGYVSTNVRYIVLAENTISPENHQAQAARDGDLKIALVSFPVPSEKMQQLA